MVNIELYFVYLLIINIFNLSFIFTDTYNLELLYLLPQLLPTGVSISKRKTTKTTKIDAQSSFLIKAVDARDLEQKLDEIRKECSSSKTSLQPVIAAIGDKQDWREFYVIFDSIKYKFGSFLESVNICFYIFFLFNLKYPDQCKNTWLFIQYYFFNIKNVFDPDVSAILTLINDLHTN